MSTATISPACGYSRRAAPARGAAAAHQEAVRLTRRGRLLLTLLFLGLVLSALTAFGSTSAATGEVGEPIATHTVMVHEGDTLWAIASELAEPGEVREMVHQIEQLNALSGASVFAGQEIAVPIDQ